MNYEPKQLQDLTSKSIDLSHITESVSEEKTYC